MTRSPLHDLHVELGARFVDFGGWERPVQYESVLSEHRAVREACGWFDVSHLGRFELKGKGAEDALLRLLCNDIRLIEPGRTQYTMMLDPSGGIVDDIVVWWWGSEEYWVFPNASNHDRVMSAFSDEPGCEVADLRQGSVLLAVQGPDGPATLERLLGVAPGRFRTLITEFDGSRVAMAGTGYTGERGGELCTDPVTAARLAEALVEDGATPCGLGARDTLRLEAGLPLWGSDIDETTNPLEAGLGFAVARDHEFVGDAALDDDIERLLIGFVLDDRGIPRHGHRVRTPEGTGTVTSGNISPMLNTGIGLAYVSPPSRSGPIEVEIRERWIPGRIVEPPFHKS